MTQQTSARLDLSAWRNDDAWEFPLRVVGVDLTNIALAMQARSKPDMTGPALINLSKVSNGNAEGLRVAGLTVVDGVPTTDLRIRVNKSTLQAVPYVGPIGTSTQLAYALLIGGTTRLTGSFTVLAHAYGSDNAQADRVQSSSGAIVDDGPESGATLTISDDGGATLVIDGAGLMGAEVERATDAADRAEAAASNPNVVAVGTDLQSATSKIIAVGTDLILGAASKIGIVATDLLKGAGSFILRAPQAAIDAVAARDAATATVTSLGGRLTTIGIDPVAGYLYIWKDRLGRYVGTVTTGGLWTLPSVRAIGGVLFGTGNRRISDNSDPGSAARVEDGRRSTLLDVRRDGMRSPAAYIGDLRADRIGGRPASSIVAFFGVGGIRPLRRTLLVNAGYGQSLAGGTGLWPVLTTRDLYGNLMFLGGVRFYEGGADRLSALVPHIEQRGPNGGETFCGGYDAMMAMLFNAYGIRPMDNPMRTLSMTPNQGETALEAFLEDAPRPNGSNLFDRLMSGFQAAMDLRGDRQVIAAPVKWLQGETRGDPPTPSDERVAKLIQLATSIDTRVRAITGQSEPVGLLSYQTPLGDGSYVFSKAAQQSSLIRIASPIYDLHKNGKGPDGSNVNTDTVHLAADGYYVWGARAAVADFCTLYLGRAWRPLQISRDARGRVRCRRINADTLRVRWDVPFDGEIVLDQTNLLTHVLGLTGSLHQQGFFVMKADGSFIPLRSITVVSRNEVEFVGTGIAVAGNTLNVGSPLLTRAGSPTSTEAAPYQAATTLRDRMGDVLTLDDLGGRPVHNPAICEGWTMTEEELSR